MGLSVSELLVAVMQNEPAIIAAAPGGIVANNAEQPQQQAGVVILHESGFVRNEIDVPVDHVHVNVVALSPDQLLTERMATSVVDTFTLFDKDPIIPTHRRVVTQPSTGETFLVHSIRVIGGIVSLPSQFVRTYWENRLVLEVSVDRRVLAVS